MIQIKEVIIVEGRYDVNVIKQLVDTTVLETGGFRIFSDKERLEMFRQLAKKRGLLILTDSDGAGLVIRNYLKGAIPPEQIKHAYIPEFFGKESRKRKSSREGKLGVEGMQPQVIYQALTRAGATILSNVNQINQSSQPITKADLYFLGLSGQPNSESLRKTVLQKLGLPKHLSSNALIEFLNIMSNLQELEEIVKNIHGESC